MAESAYFHSKEAVHDGSCVSTIGWKVLFRACCLEKYSVEEGYDTIDAIIAYGNENQPSFVKEFSCTRLTREEEKKKKSKIIAVWLTTIAGMTGIVLIISLQVSIASEIEQRKNEARTAAVLEKLQAAINGKGPVR
mgnify:CR=1 FL=1